MKRAAKVRWPHRQFEAWAPWCQTDTLPLNRPAERAPVTLEARRRRTRAREAFGRLCNVQRPNVRLPLRPSDAR